MWLLGSVTTLRYAAVMIATGQLGLFCLGCTWCDPGDPVIRSVGWLVLMGTLLFFALSTQCSAVVLIWEEGGELQQAFSMLPFPRARKDKQKGVAHRATPPAVVGGPVWRVSVHRMG